MSLAGDVLLFSGVEGILLFHNGGGYIPYFFEGLNFRPGKMITKLSELDELIKNHRKTKNIKNLLRRFWLNVFK